MTGVRPAAVAGLFYPESGTVVRSQVADLVAGAAPPRLPGPVKALIAPHAGYIYSGPIAGSAFAALGERAPLVRRVVLLGPAHRHPVRGLALPGAERFATPLGEVPVDAELAAAVAELPQVTVSSAAHAQEHSLEVELPFLQMALGEFTVLPLVVGDASAEEVAEVLERVWGGAETLIVISSDLSHYLEYGEACALDRETADRILELRDDLSHQRACGATPVNGLLLAARRRGLEASLLDLRNSGDTAGDRRQVVGYGAFAFTEPA